MMSDQHIATAFDRDLEAIQALLMKMGGLVEENIRAGAAALKDRDVDQAEAVRRADKLVDDLEEKITQECARVLALRQPAASDLRTVLTVMKVATNLERIGDYAKNIFDLTKVGLDLEAGPREAALVPLKDKISKLLVRAHGLFERQDTAKAREFLSEVVELEDECDAAVEELLRLSGRNTSPAVLTYRYFKRVISHIGNVVTSLVVPLDKLDYFDEPRDKQ